MSLLSAGAGAADGLKEMLTEMLAQEANKRANRQTDETGRHNLAQEDLEGKRIEATDRERASRDAMVAANYRDQSEKAVRDDGRALAEEIPGGTPLDEGDSAIPQITKAGLGGLLRGMKATSSTPMEEPNAMGGESTVSSDPDMVSFSGKEMGPKSKIKLRTAAQNEKMIADKRAEDAAAETGRHNVAMENKPSSSDNALIRTGDGYMRRKDAAGVLAGGGEVPGPDSAQVTNRRDMATAVGSHFDDAEQLINDADSKGLLGPIGGRTFAEFLAGKVGSTGNAENDELLGDLRTSLGMVRSGTASLHGRSGANVGIAKDIERKMDEGHMSAAELKGSLHALRKWVNTYATKKGKGGGGGGDMSAEDLIKKYGGQ